MLFLFLFRGISRTNERTNALTKAFEPSKTKKMIPTQEMLSVISPVVSALFIGLWVLVTMGWVMNVDDIARGRRAVALASANEVEAEAADDAGADEGLNQVVPDSDDVEEEQEEPEEELAPAPVPEHVLIAQAFESLLATVEEEKEKTERMQQAVYQLLGGMYNHQTQDKTLMYDVNYLYGKKQTEDGAYETEEDMVIRRGEHQFPTTRQGDEHAIRIDLLENMVNELKAKVEEQAQELNTVAWNDNDIFMRMHDLEEKVGIQEQVLDTITLSEPQQVRKTLEERVRDLECMM
jgi:hypothetical protein